MSEKKEKRFVTRSIYTSSAANAWSSPINVPFKVGKMLVHPIIYNFQDAGDKYGGSASSKAYRQYCVMSNITGDTRVMGIIMETTYSTGMNPVSGYSYMFDSPTDINGNYNFFVTDLDMKTPPAAANSADMKMLITFEFYEY